MRLHVGHPHPELKTLFPILILLVALLPLRAQTTINYVDGEINSTNYNTSAPNNPTTLSTATGTATQSGTITGSGGVTVTGTGTLLLTGTNTYSGGTIINFGTLTVQGTGGSISHSSAALYVGYNNDDNGTLLISNGGIVTNSTGSIGGSPSTSTTASGTVTVSGATGDTNSTWANNNDLYVGYAGAGTLNISDGGQVSNGTGYIANGSQASTVSVDGINANGTASNWANSGTLNVGYNGAGTLSITNGAKVSNATGYIGVNSSSSGTATVSGATGSVNSTWTNSSNLNVGYVGAGTLNVLDGGQVSDVNGFISVFNGVGTATIDGVNANDTASSWANSGTLYVGYGGAGTLNISNSGIVSSPSVVLANSGTASGTLNLSFFGVLQTGSISAGTGSGGGAINFKASGILRATGNSSDFISGFGPGAVTLGDGGGIIDNNGYSITINTVIGGNGTLNAVGTGTLTLTNANTYSGGTVVGLGTLTVQGTGGSISHAGAPLFISSSSDDSATLLISNGGAVTSFEGNIGGGAFDSSIATATVSGATGNTNSTWTNTGDLHVGYTGIGALNVSNGGQVTDVNGYISYLGATGTVTIDGINANGTASNWTSSDDLYVGYNGAGTLSITNGGQVSNTTDYIGGGPSASTPGSGTVTVSGATGGKNSTWTNTGDLYVGYATTGTLNITNGGQVSNDDSYIASNNGFGIVTVDGINANGTASSLTTSNHLYVGYDGAGMLSITNGGQVTDTFGAIAFGLPSDGTQTGTVTVDGINANGTASRWANSGDMYVGYRGDGTLKVTNGGQVTDVNGYISVNNTSGATDSSGTATIDGVNANGTASRWANSGALYVGFNSDGMLSVINGAQVSDTTGYIGGFLRTTPSGTVEVSGATGNTNSTWTNSSDLYVGYEGAGTLSVANGGQVSDVNGYISDSNVGTVTIDGVNTNGTASKWVTNGNLNVGYNNAGSLAITNGAQVTDIIGYISGGPSASTPDSGTVTVSGATGNTNSTWTNSNTLFVGYSSAGTLNISDGGQVTSSSAGIANGSQVAIDGVNANSSASSWAINGTLTVGSDSAGILSITNGAKLSTTSDGYIAGRALTAATGTVTVSGATGNTNSTWTDSGNLYVGYTGAGTLNISDGGQVTDVSGYIANGGPNSIATVDGVNANGTASKWTNSSTLYVGYGGDGTLAITNGGQVSSSSGIVAFSVHATVTIDGVNANGTASSWADSGTLSVGLIGDGTLTLTNGAQLSDTSGSIGGDAFQSGATGTVTVSGATGNTNSTWTSSSGLIVGNAGAGTLNISNGGIVNSPSVILASTGSGQGTLNLNSNGVLQTGSVGMGTGSGGGTINFNGGILRATGNNSDFISGFAPGAITLASGGGTIDSNGYAITVNAILGGGGALTSTGTGTLTLTNTNTYTGGTSVAAGTLAYGSNSNLGSGGVSLATGGALQYTGSTSGTLSQNITVTSGTGEVTNTGTSTLTLTGTITKTDTTFSVTGKVNINGLIQGTGSAYDSDVDYNHAISTVSTQGTYFGTTHIFNTSTVTNGINEALPSTAGAASADTTLILGDASETSSQTNIYALGGFTQTLAGITSTTGTGTDSNQIIGGSATTSALTLNIPNVPAGNNDIYSGLLGNGVAGASNANNLSLTKSGAGILTLTNANTYTGGTEVMAGRLVASNASGSATGSGALKVDSGATLSGTGTINSSTNTINGTVQAGAGGTDTTGILTMTATGTTTFSNANLVFNLSTTSLGQSNELNLGSTPNVLFSNTTLTLNLVGAGIIPDTTEYILLTSSITGSGAGGSIFAGITVDGSGVISGLNFTFNNAPTLTYYQNSYLKLVSNGTGYNIDVEIVPEPGTWALLLGGLVLTLCLHTRSRRETRFRAKCSVCYTNNR